LTADRIACKLWLRVMETAPWTKLIKEVTYIGLIDSAIPEKRKDQGPSARRVVCMLPAGSHPGGGVDGLGIDANSLGTI